MKRRKAAAGRTVALAISAAMALTSIAPAQIFGGELIFTDSEAGAVDEGLDIFTEAPEQSAEVPYVEPAGDGIIFDGGEGVETEPPAEYVTDEIIDVQEFPVQISPELPAAPAESTVFDAVESADEAVPEDVVIFGEETAAVQAAPAEDVVVVDEPEEEIFDVDTLFSDADLTAAVGGTEGTPPQVTGVNIYYAAETDSTPDSLRWDYVQGVFTYEIEVSDGSQYYEIIMSDGVKLADVDKGASTDYIPYRLKLLDALTKFPSVDLQEFAQLIQVTRQDDGIHKQRLADYNAGLCMKNGKTYQFRVRAVYVNGGVSAFGEWSDPVSYTVPKSMTPVELGTLTFLSSEWNDAKTGVYYTLNYSGDINGGDVLVDVATAQSFKTSTITHTGLKSQKDTKNAETPDNPEKLRVFVPATAAQIGDYRYFRAHNEVDGVPVKDDDGNTVYSNVIGTAIPEQVVATPTPVPHESVLTWPEKLEMTTQDANTANFSFTMNVSGEELKHWGYYVIVYDNAGDEHRYYYNYTGIIPPGFEFSKLPRWFSVDKSSFLMDKTYYVRVIPYYCEKEIDAAVFSDIENGKQEVMEGSPSNTVHFAKTKFTSVKDFRMDGLYDGKYHFLYDGNIYDIDGLEIWFSRSSKFPSDRELTYVDTTVDPEEYAIETGFHSGKFSFKPGTTYYVRIRPYIVDPDPERAEFTHTYGDYSKVVSFTTQKPVLSVTAQTITNNEVKFEVESTVPEYSTGYIYERKVGSSWLVLSNTTNNVLTDSGLDANTTYVYRVKSYYFDEATGKNTNSSAYAYLTVTTWGGKLNLKATQTAATWVKLDWSKVAGATSYEVYKKVSEAEGTNYSAGEVINDVNTWQRIATLKNTVTTYKATGLYGDVANLMVRAVKTVSKKTYTISESRKVELTFSNMELDVKSKSSTNGSVTASWTALYGATGYKVEKLQDTTGTWVDYKTLAASVTSITLPAASETTEYRIRGYKTASGITQFTGYQTVKVNPFLKAPTGVKASISKTEKGAITVSWTAVPGADYYVVYRTTSSSFTFNKDLGTYSYTNAKALKNYVPAAKKLSGFAQEDPAYPTHVTGTTLTDRPVTYTNATNGKTVVVNEGPRGGMIYYYYVRAYKKTDRGAIISSGGSQYAKARYSKITKPATPSITKLTPTTGKVTITWKKPARAEGYFLLRSTNSKKTAASFRQIAYISKGTTLKYVDTTVKKGTTYYYKLIAFNKNEINSYLRSTDSVIKSVKAK